MNTPIFDKEAFKQAIFPQLKVHEGLRLDAYYDTKHILTIGIGHNVEANPTSSQIGRNITQRGERITEAEAMTLFNHDIEKFINQVIDKIPVFLQLSQPRQLVLVDMAFNLGIGVKGESGLLKFQQTLAAIESGDYNAAADFMRHSRWAGQVGKRSQRLALMMQNNLSFTEVLKQIPA